MFEEYRIMRAANGERRWDELTAQEQVELRVAFGHFLDLLPATCSLETKLQRFQAWLAERGIDFQKEDLNR
jgi:hypothetical protein